MLNRRFGAIVVVIVLALAALYFFAAGSSARVSASTVPAPVSVPPAPAAAQTTLQVLGTFSAPTQATISFKASGRIARIDVQEGQQVKKGDALAVLDSTEQQLAVQQAQAALAGAQARLSQTKNSATDADTAAAQAAVNAALQTYEKVRAGPTANDLAALKAQVDNAKAALDLAQSAYDRAGGSTNPNIGLLPQSLQLQTATNNHNAAVAGYNSAQTHPTPSELAGAWAQVQQAQDALSRLTPNSDNIAASQAAVDQAQAALSLAQAQVADATLTAPFDATVLWLGPHVGEFAGPTSPFLILADLTHLQLQAGVDENLLASVQVGQTVTVTPQAYKDRVVTGHVSRIGQLATTTGGVINVPVTIDLDPGASFLRPGLSATAEIQIASQ